MGLFSGARAAARDLAGALLPLSVRDLEREIAARLARAPLQLNEYGFDPFGFHPDTAAKTAVLPLLLYRHWFRAETHGIDKVPQARVMLICNHAGQMPYDGLMVTMAMLMEAEPPRLCRGMAEYFIWRLPFGSIAAARGGAASGTPLNCVQLLQREECVLVFPEGAHGINKPFSKRYQLQEFGLGFMRLALETRTPIVPVGIVGSEEQQPGLANLQGAARVLGLPSLPITLSFPLLGPAGLLLALPVKYQIHFGEPLHFEGDHFDEDALIQEKVDVVRNAIDDLLQRGLASRTGVFF